MRPQRQRRRPPQAPVNKYVKAQKLTVIDNNGEKLGVYSKDDALKIAQDQMAARALGLGRPEGQGNKRTLGKTHGTISAFQMDFCRGGGGGLKTLSKWNVGVLQ